MAYWMEGLAGGVAGTGEGADGGVVDGRRFLREAGDVLLQEGGGGGVSWGDYLVCVSRYGRHLGQSLGDWYLQASINTMFPQLTSWPSLGPHDSAIRMRHVGGTCVLHGIPKSDPTG